MTPQLQQNAPPPPGGMPRGKNLIVVAIGLAAVIIVVAASFTGATSRPATPATVTPASMPPTSAPTSADIRRFTRQLQEEDARLKAAQEAADRVGTLRQQPGGGMEPGPVQGGFSQAGAGGGPAAPPVVPTKSALEMERERRRAEALYASHLVSFAAPAPPVLPARPVPAVIPTPPSPAAAQVTRPAAATEKGEPSPLFTLFEGTEIAAVLTNRLTGQFSGPVNCQVSYAVWSRDHLHILIPQGSRVLGEASRVTDQDQERLAITFHRLILTSGFAIDLDRVPGLDQQGATALKDKTNHHYLSTFVTAAMLGVLSGFSIAGTGNAYNGGGVDAYRQGMASQMSQSGTRILDRQLSRMPTITIREGHRVNIYLTRDLQLADARDHKEVL